MEGGKQPAMYNPSPVPKGKESCASGILVILLCSALVMVSLIASSVMAANKTSDYVNYKVDRSYNTTYLDTRVTFSQVHAFVGLLTMDIIVCGCAIVQVVLSLVKVCTRGVFVSSPTRGGNMITFVCDLVLLSALIAAAAAAANSLSILSNNGYCDNSTPYCRKTSVSIIMSFVAFAVLALLTALYPIRLLRMSK